MGALSLPGEDIAAGVVSLVKDGIDRIWPDPKERDDAKLAQLQAVIGEGLERLKAQVSVIVSEASGTGLKANWRPITMLCFVGLIVNNVAVVPYLQAFGLHVPMLQLPPDLWSLIKDGLVGYVAARSGEKMVPHIVDAVKSLKK